jgi:hypothetical protein
MQGASHLRRLATLARDFEHGAVWHFPRRQDQLLNPLLNFPACSLGITLTQSQDCSSH